jgi:hypothetical protein
MPRLASPRGLLPARILGFVQGLLHARTPGFIRRALLACMPGFVQGLLLARTPGFIRRALLACMPGFVQGLLHALCLGCGRCISEFPLLGYLCTNSCILKYFSIFDLYLSKDALSIVDIIFEARLHSTAARTRLPAAGGNTSGTGTDPGAKGHMAFGRGMVCPLHSGGMT